MTTASGSVATSRLRTRRTQLREGLRRRPRTLLVATTAVLAVLVVVAVGFGTVWIPPETTLGIVLHRGLGLDTGLAWSPASEAIVWDLRVPRVLTAAMVGAALAVAGATFQGLLRNPLNPWIKGRAMPDVPAKGFRELYAERQKKKGAR